MTRKEAAELITQVYERQIKNTFLLSVKDEVMLKIDKAFDIAIKALEQQPCDDAVSRQAVLEPYRILKKTDTLCVAVIRANIMQLPSVRPQEPNKKIVEETMVEWVKDDTPCKTGSIVCRECGTEISFCPICGAEISEE